MWKAEDFADELLRDVDGRWEVPAVGRGPDAADVQKEVRGCHWRTLERFAASWEYFAELLDERIDLYLVTEGLVASVAGGAQCN